MKNEEQCPARYIVDLVRGNVEAKILIIENSKTKWCVKLGLWKGKTKP